jgi:DNA-binding NtrC family response regulator
MTHPRPVALIVDRDDEGARSLSGFLRANGFEVAAARDGESAHQALEANRVDCLVSELRVPRIDGFPLLRHGFTRNPELCAVVIADPDQVPLALEAMREGAHDFQFRPIQFEKLLAVLVRGLSHQRLAARVVEMTETLDERLGVDHFKGASRSIDRVRDQIRQMAASRATVLIEGEPGTGKGLAARTVHHNSPCRDEPFVWLNFAALPPDEAERELFGSDEASGASEVRRGRLESAGGGTLLLDEVGAATSAIQVKLLRLLQDREYERVGGSRTLKAQARVIATSARDLEAEARGGGFREDLLHRLSAVRLKMPPLRERLGDIPLLVEAFIREANHARGRKVSGITPGALDRLMSQPWPGNVRELRSVVEGMIAVVDRRRALDLSDLPPAMVRQAGAGESLDVTVGMTVGEVERRLIAATLRHTGGDKPRAAGLLGIGLRTLYRRIRELRLE